MAREDGIYAMRFASQQMFIDKLQQENQQLKADLEMYENGVYFSSENDKLQEKNTQLRIEISAIEEDYRKLEKIVKDVGMWNTLYNEEFNKNKKLAHNWNKLKEYINEEIILQFYDDKLPFEIIVGRILNKMNELESGVSIEN